MYKVKLGPSVTGGLSKGGASAGAVSGSAPSAAPLPLPPSLVLRDHSRQLGQLGFLVSDPLASRGSLVFPPPATSGTGAPSVLLMPDASASASGNANPIPGSATAAASARGGVVEATAMRRALQVPGDALAVLRDIGDGTLDPLERLASELTVDSPLLAALSPPTAPAVSACPVERFSLDGDPNHWRKVRSSLPSRLNSSAKKLARQQQKQWTHAARGLALSDAQDPSLNGILDEIAPLPKQPENEEDSAEARAKKSSARNARRRKKKIKLSEVMMRSFPFLAFTFSCFHTS